MTTVIEGEVVSTSRRIERNAARTPEVLPPDVDTKVVAIRRLDSPEMQTRAITTMLSHARTGLLAAIAAQDLPQIVEFKQKAAAIQEIVKQVRLGKDLQLDAAEFVRRAERGLGVAIREGQQSGSVATPDEVASAAAKVARGTFPSRQNALSKPADTDFADRSELSGNSTKGQFGIYGMTDDVSDEQFEEALAEAKAEGNLSRANVARKAKAKAQKKEPIDADDPLIDAEVESAPKPAAPPKKRLTKHDSTEMLANINGMLNGIVETLPFINPTEVDPTDADNKRVIENMRQSMARIRRLLKEIEHG